MNVTAPISNDLRSLYQEIILDHGKSPRNFGVVDHHTCRAQGNNPMCGDRITVTARVTDSRTLEDVAFEGKGCAISIASASMMTEALKGKTAGAVRQLSKAVQDLCTGKADADEARASLPENLAGEIDRLASLSGVHQFPVRVKCATLSWHALNSCLEGKSQATTEK